MTDWLTKLISTSVEKAFSKTTETEAFDKALERIIRENLKQPKYAQFVFIKHIQAELMRVDPLLPADKAIIMARNVLQTHLQDEGIKFGDPAYDWTRSGAVDLAHAYEIDHWECVA